MTINHAVNMIVGSVGFDEYFIRQLKELGRLSLGVEMNNLL